MSGFQKESTPYPFTPILNPHLSHKYPPGTKNQGRGTGTNTHQPLQSREFDRLNALPQASYFLFNARLRLLNSHLLAIGLLANASLLEIEVQPDGGLRATDFIA